MAFSFREFWTAVHGMALGFGFILFFTASLALLLTLSPGFLTPKGVKRNIILLKISGLVIGTLSWLAVFVGTYIALSVVPGGSSVGDHGPGRLPTLPRLLANAAVSGWHNFGMEWKEHLGWLVPIMATVAVYLIFRNGEKLVKERKIHWTLFVILCLAFVTAGVVGTLGAIITKEAPVV